MPNFASSSARFLGYSSTTPAYYLLRSPESSGYPSTENKKREDFRSFLDDVLASQPSDKEIHVILDNYSPHKGNDDWLRKFEGRVQFHFTPTSASWLNQIEIVFSLLQRKTLNGATFKSKYQLREAIEAFIRRHNERAKPCRWRTRARSS